MADQVQPPAPPAAGGAAAPTPPAPDALPTPIVTQSKPPTVTVNDLQAAPPPKPPEPPPAPPPAKKEVTLASDEDEIPDDVDLVHMSRKVLTGRLERHTKAQLRERFGTDDVGKIKAALDAAKEYEEKKEADRQAQLTKEQKLEENARRLRGERDEFKRQLRRELNERAIESVQGRIDRSVEKFVDPSPEIKAVAFRAYADHLKSLSKDDLNALYADEKNTEMEKFFSSWAESHPKFAKEPPALPTIEQPLTNGKGTEDRPNSKDPKQNVGPEFSPSADNAMDSAEARAKAREKGYSWT